jgi:hypothetical protein
VIITVVGMHLMTRHYRFSAAACVRNSIPARMQRSLQARIPAAVAIVEEANRFSPVTFKIHGNSQRKWDRATMNGEILLESLPAVGTAVVPHLRKGDVVYDLGAGRGNMVLFFAVLGGGLLTAAGVELDVARYARPQ